jgi:hypothetical protein
VKVGRTLSKKAGNQPKKQHYSKGDARQFNKK